MKTKKDEDFYYESKRLVEISDALRSLHKKCHKYIDKYENSCKNLIKTSNNLLIFHKKWTGKRLNRVFFQ